MVVCREAFLSSLVIVVAIVVNENNTLEVVKRLLPY